VIGCPVNEAYGISTIKNALIRKQSRKTPHFEKGDPIFQGYLTSGDLVLVDKVSYHFRQPKRGESFVFDTRDIDTDGPDRMSSQAKGDHYIKRLSGVPGDTIQIDEPNLYINGDKATEETLLRVMSKEPDSKVILIPDTPIQGELVARRPYFLIQVILSLSMPILIKGIITASSSPWVTIQRTVSIPDTGGV
jgi:signal peptidase I